jgi:hypothetical protein
VNNAHISKRSSGEKGQPVAPVPPPHCFGKGGSCPRWPRGSGAPANMAKYQVSTSILGSTFGLAQYSNLDLIFCHIYWAQKNPIRYITKLRIITRATLLRRWRPWNKFVNEVTHLGPVVRRPDSAIHRIVIFPSFVKSVVDWYNSY